MSQQIKTISVDELAKSPYNILLSYPKANQNASKRILRKLEDVGLTAVLIRGNVEINGIKVLGKGCTAVVFAAETEFGHVAVKVLRSDADRVSLKSEAKFLRKVNSVGIGPKLYHSKDEFLILELVEGKRIGDYVQELKGRGTTKRLKSVVRELLRQCFVLDQKGIAHCELSNPIKHVIVREDDKPVIIDFESASEKKKYSNLTAITQSFFIGGKLSPKIRRILKIKELKPIIEALKKYKYNPNNETYKEILQVTRVY
ncbi:MAG: serine/threonine protein kinase [Nitrososphaeria archaeon]